jgi:hypothetical protein
MLRPLLLAGLLALVAVAPAQGSPAAAAAVGDEAARVAQLERRVVELLAEQARLRGERDRLQRLLDRLTSQVDQFEADRILLTELRKELPETRGEAETYLQRLRRLALVSDPVRLAPLAGRMMEVAPVFLDWRHTPYPNAEARTRAFAESGAHGFPTALTNFRNAVLLSASNRIEGLLILVE